MHDGQWQYHIPVLLVRHPQHPHSRIAYPSKGGKPQHWRPAQDRQFGQTCPVQVVPQIEKAQSTSKTMRPVEYSRLFVCALWQTHFEHC